MAFLWHWTAELRYATRRFSHKVHVFVRDEAAWRSHRMACAGGFPIPYTAVSHQVHVFAREEAAWRFYGASRRPMTRTEFVAARHHYWCRPRASVVVAAATRHDRIIGRLLVAGPTTGPTRSPHRVIRREQAHKDTDRIRSEFVAAGALRVPLRASA